jgi:phosphoadenosine phosphosulfate reductase
MPEVTQTSRLAADLAPLDALARLNHLRRTTPGRIVFTSSLGIEDQVLTHLIFTEALDIEIATLDTGRLFPETYALWAETEMHYARRIRGVFPEREGVEALVADQGINGFQLSVEARKACCALRKVEPLRRVLSGASAWVTGLRASQSHHRGTMPIAEFDPGFGLLKVNPLIDWSRAEIDDFVARNAVPVNPLHARGFPSIGCQPCTRAVQPGEDERAGRWWWEQEGARECGLHVDASGRLVRAEGTPA